METSLVIKEGESFNVLVHYHIMKNAGSTLSALLQREFGHAFTELHAPAANSMIATSELVAFIKEHPEIRAISSHHIRFPVPKQERLHFACCCFLRHPLDRLHSLYNFFRAGGDHGIVGQLAQTCDIPTFFSELMERFPNYVCNIQTNYIACGGFFLRPSDREDLRTAIRIMREATLPGLVDRIDESLAIAEYFLKPVFPSLRLHYTPQNVRREMDRSVKDRELEFKELCGTKIYRQLEVLNRLDLELVRTVDNEIDRRRELIPAFQSRLADFKNRCSHPALSLAPPLAVAQSPWKPFAQQIRQLFRI